MFRFYAFSFVFVLSFAIKFRQILTRLNSNFNIIKKEKLKQKVDIFGLIFKFVPKLYFFCNSNSKFKTKQLKEANDYSE